MSEMPANVKPAPTKSVHAKNHGEAVRPRIAESRTILPATTRTWRSSDQGLRCAVCSGRPARSQHLSANFRRGVPPWIKEPASIPGWLQRRIPDIHVHQSQLRRKLRVVAVTDSESQLLPFPIAQYMKIWQY